MLTIINLYTIDKIFSEVSTVKLSGQSQMIYINCLMHHFRNKPPKISSSVAFEIFEEDFKDYSKYKKNFQELHKSGLVTIGAKSIIFNNVWGKYIDKTKLEKVSPEEYVAGFNFQSISSFKQEIINSRSLLELVQMRYKITKVQLEKLIEIFIKEQETFDKKYHNFSDCIKHCTYWIGSNLDKIPKESSVKSTGKILGQ